MNKKGHIDWYIMVTVVALMLFSIAFVYSASASIAEARFGSPEKFFWNHSVRIFLGILSMFIFAKIDYHVWEKISKPLIFLSIIPLILVFFVGTPINGAYRWISYGVLNFQPSELAKFAMVFHFSVLLSQRQEFIKEFKYGLAPFLVWSLIVCSLIAIQPNFSTASVIFLIAISMMFIGNANVWQLLMIGFISLTGAGLYAVSATYRMNRLLAFLDLHNITDVSNEAGFQTQQAMIALGNGWLFGLGPGQSRQSHLFLPESYGDFIFSIIGEEYGFLGVLIIIAAFVLIFWRGILIAKKSPDLFGYFLASGILITIAVYVLINAGVNSGLLPTTGLPMPFVSYGGTAVIFYASAIGVLLNISAQAGVFPQKV